LKDVDFTQITSSLPTSPEIEERRFPLPTYPETEAHQFRVAFLIFGGLLAVPPKASEERASYTNRFALRPARLTW
jgi:hypothetical protein